MHWIKVLSPGKKTPVFVYLEVLEFIVILHESILLVALHILCWLALLLGRRILPRLPAAGSCSSGEGVRVLGRWLRIEIAVVKFGKIITIVFFKITLRFCAGKAQQRQEQESEYWSHLQSRLDYVGPIWRFT